MQVQEPGRRQKDEEKAMKLGLTKEECKKLVPMSMEEFNEFTQKRRFDEENLSILRDMRRRGKNKVAAQNCRKRKLENIEDLTQKVGGTQSKLDQLREETKLARRFNEDEKENIRRLAKNLEADGKKILCSICETLTESCFTKKICVLTVIRI